MSKELPFPPEYVARDLCNAQFKSDRPSKGGETMVRCPIQTKKWISLNLSKGGYWKCFQNCADCPANGGGGILNFYQLFFNCASPKDAYKEIMQKYEGTDATLKERREQGRIEVAPEAPKKDVEQLDSVYRALLSRLPLSDLHREDLLKRGMKEEDIETMMFRSIPQVGMSAIAVSLVNDGYRLDGVPGFYKKGSEYRISAPIGGGYFIPYFNADAQIQGLQIRKDVDLKGSPAQIQDAKKKRYRWFTSSGEFEGCAASNVPFYGIPDKKRKQVAYLTEGGLKAATAQSLSGGWFLAIPGVSCFGAWEELLIFLKDAGVKKIVDAFDSDRATNPNVQHNIDLLHEKAKEHGFDMQLWDWGTEEKGVDDFLLRRKQEREKIPEKRQ